MVRRLIANDDKQVADNYVLIQDKEVITAPETVRLDRNSIDLLQEKATLPFGFGKFQLGFNSADWTNKKSLPIKAIYSVTRGEEWSLVAARKKEVAQLIQHRQIAANEEVQFAAASYFMTSSLPALSKWPRVKYGHLQLGPWDKMPESLL